MTAPGSQFDYQYRVQGQRGGLSYYPFCGIINGLIVSTPALVDDATDDKFTVNVSAGSAKLDGQLVTLAANLTGLTLNPGLGSLLAADAVIPIYLTPDRMVWTSTDVPATKPNGDALATDDMYIKVLNQTTYETVEGAYRRTATPAWVDYNLIEAKPGYSQSNLPLNKVRPALDSGATGNVSFTLTPELDVYHKTMYPPYVNGPSSAYLRKGASIHIATVTLTAGTPAVTFTYGEDMKINL